MDRNYNHTLAERVIKKALRAIKYDKVKRDSSLRDAPLSEDSYPETTYKVAEVAMSTLVEDYELVLQYFSSQTSGSA